MQIDWKQTYITLVDFLGKALGPDYEIVLHSFEKDDYRLIAIANEAVSGRNISGPISDLALSFITDKEYNHSDYKCSYDGVAANGDALRCSTMFIKDDKGTLLGMLCINFRSGKYTQFAQQVINFMSSNFPESLSDEALVESFGPGSTEDTIAMCSVKLFGSKALPEHMTKSDKLALIKELNKRGLFNMKSSVLEVSNCTGISKASIYRYLGQII